MTDPTLIGVLRRALADAQAEVERLRGVIAMHEGEAKDYRAEVERLRAAVKEAARLLTAPTDFDGCYLDPKRDGNLQDWLAEHGGDDDSA